MSTEAVQTQVQHLSTQDEAAQGLHSGPVSVNFHPYLLAIVHLSHRSNGWVTGWRVRDGAGIPLPHDNL